MARRVRPAAVIRASVLMGGRVLRPRAGSEPLWRGCSRFCELLWSCIPDTRTIWLDVTGDASMLGKATGADSERAKPTHPRG